MANQQGCWRTSNEWINLSNKPRAVLIKDFGLLLQENMGILNIYFHSNIGMQQLIKEATASNSSGSTH